MPHRASVFSKDSTLLSKLRILTVALLTEGIVLPKSVTIPLVEALCQLQVKVTQLCLTLCDPTDYTVHGILQARVLEWVSFPFPGDIPNPGIEPRSSALQADSLVQFSSVAQSCPALCHPMDTGLPILHYHWELTQTHVH